VYFSGPLAISNRTQTCSLNILDRCLRRSGRLPELFHAIHDRRHHDRDGHYSGWGVGYGYSTQTHVSQYTEGTFNIDLVDIAEKQLVWEAVGVGKVTDDFLENLEQGVMEGVPKFFAGYPFVAGSSAPVTGDSS